MLNAGRRVNCYAERQAEGRTETINLFAITYGNCSLYVSVAGLYSTLIFLLLNGHHRLEYSFTASSIEHSLCIFTQRSLKHSLAKLAWQEMRSVKWDCVA